MNMVRTIDDGSRKTHSQNGFDVPKPELPLAQAAWVAADRYGRGSDAIVEALFHAIVQLEKVVHDLETSANDG